MLGETNSKNQETAWIKKHINSGFLRPNMSAILGTKTDEMAKPRK
jgi:hypothetical protein